MADTSTYPAALDGDLRPLVPAGTAPSGFEDFAQLLADAVAKIETELGTNPSGAAATVAAAIAALAPLASPAFTGTPTAPTAAGGTNSTQLATTAFVAAAQAALVDSSPATLDTLNELAAALGDDPNFATTVTTALAAKLDTATAAATYAPLDDPYGWGTVLNTNPSAHCQQTSLPAANFALWTRLQGAGAVNAMRLFVVNSSGNISVAVYADSNGYPGARVLDTGSIACPAGSAIADVSLGGSVAVTHGSHWVRFSVDNTTATFLVATNLAQVLPFPGWSYASAGTFLAPANAPGSMDPFTNCGPVMGGRNV